jgi:sulfide:quinone oxidoreductase
MKKIVVLGGGTGGTLAANLLVKKLKPEEASVTLVSASPRHLYQPGWLYVPFGWQDPRALSRPLKSLLNDRVELKIARVTGLDATARRIETDEGGLDYDYLVIATGARVTPEDVPGFVEGAQHFYTEEAAWRLHAALGDFQGGKIVVGVGGLPHRCPVAPLEFAFLLDEWLTRQGLREKTEITYTYPINRPFTIQSVSEKVEPLLAERKITVETFFNLESVDPEQKIAYSLEGSELPYDLLVMIPPHRGARFLEGNPIADEQGWVKTDRESLEVKGFPGHYALGDATDLPISKAGSTAHFEAPVIVERITASVRNVAPHGKHAKYDGHVMCFLEAGHSKASFLDFTYTRPPQVRDPNVLVHYGKLAFNRAYWRVVPTGLF